MKILHLTHGRSLAHISNQQMSIRAAGLKCRSSEPQLPCPMKASGWGWGKACGGPVKKDAASSSLGRCGCLAAADPVGTVLPSPRLTSTCS